MKLLLTLIATTLISLLQAQFLADFENLSIPQDSFLNGSDGHGGFISGSALLPNSYSTEFNSWTGWAISNKQDSTTPGFQNQYSAITAGGVDESSNYAVSFSSGPNTILLQEGASGKPVAGLYVTNGTYPYLSMRDGDAFAKRFGGETGDDPDFFRLTIKYFADGELSEDSLDFYLADFRFPDNSQDYIINEWTFIDLSSFGNIDSLWFQLSSSDVGMFGMNTPAYFCIDNLATGGSSTSAKEPTKLAFTMFPNPVDDGLQVSCQDFPLTYSVMDDQGRILMDGKIMHPTHTIPLAGLFQGIYRLRLVSDHQVGVQSFIKSSH